MRKKEKKGEFLTYLWLEHRRPKLPLTTSPEVQSTQTRRQGEEDS